LCWFDGNQINFGFETVLERLIANVQQEGDELEVEL
jgi:hypothetical protein